MRREDDHWILFRYLKTPIIDTGAGRPVSHIAIQMPENMAYLFKDGSLGSVCVNELRTGHLDREVAETLFGKLKDGGTFCSAYRLPKEIIDLLKGKFRIRVIEDRGFTIVKRLSGKNGIEKLEPKKPDTRKRVCISRYGAYGDHLMCTPLIQYYHDEGYHVTYNSTNKGIEVLKGDPRIDDLFVQEHNVVSPKRDVFERYMRCIKEDYDEFVELHGVLEHDMLRAEGSPGFDDPHPKRMLECSGNYIDHHFERAGLDIKGRNPSPHITKKEREWAATEIKNIKRKLGKSRIVLWNIMGSSFHKMYPWTFDVWKRVLDNGDDIGFVVVGDVIGHILTGKEYDKVVYNLCGRTSIRQSIAMHSVVDAVVTPETWSLIASFAFDAPCIALLSHSDKSNYNWKPNDIPLHADTSKCPCYPCHQIHFTRQSCPPGFIEKKATRCMDQIEPDTVYNAIKKALPEEESGDNLSYA